MDERFEREALIIGVDGVEKLKKSSVLVFGCGGVGGYAVEALARSGIGTLCLVDGDRFAKSNLNRQLHALESTIGEFKAQTAAARCRDINPEINALHYNVFYNDETAEQFDFTQYNYIVDAVDDVPAKILIAQNAEKSGTPLISSMGAGNKLDPTAFAVADIYKTSVCPLAKKMRYELKKRGIKGYKAVYSKEPAVKPKYDENSPSRPPGSIAFVPAAAGLALAGEVVKDLLELH